jgi:hypothetical protein
MGLAYALVGLLIEQLFWIKYNREKSALVQDKSRTAPG